ncbi:MAG: TIM-barrel domain-containing protein, partial [Chloroflexota bacterium]
MTHAFDLDAFVNDHDRPLHLVRRVLSVAALPDGVFFHCETRQFQRSYRDRYGTLVEVAEDTGAGLAATVAITFASSAVMRFRMSAGSFLDNIPANKTPMLVDDYAPDVLAFEMIETDDAISLKTADLRVTIYRDPWRMTVRNASGKLLFDTVPAAVFQHPPTGMSGIGIENANITDAWPWFFRDIYPLGFVHDAETGLTQTFETNRMRHDEHFYGFGEKFGSVDKRGQMINLWHENATGNTRTNSYKNVPFFLSSRGYGLYINSAYPIRYHMGDRHHTHYSLHLQHNLLDYFLIAGDSYKEILPRYTALTGTPGLPPKWSFGLWMSRMSYDNQPQVEEVAEKMREYDIPCDVIHIDTDWFAEPWVNDLTFSTERFPDPAGMVAKLREMGFRVTLWQIPYIAQESVFYAEGVENGYFALSQDGTPRHIQGFFGEAAVIDYSNPRAVAWMQSKFEPLFE